MNAFEAGIENGLEKQAGYKKHNRRTKTVWDDTPIGHPKSARGMWVRRGAKGLALAGTAAASTYLAHRILSKRKKENR